MWLELMEFHQQKKTNVRLGSRPPSSEGSHTRLHVSLLYFYMRFHFLQQYKTEKLI